MLDFKNTDGETVFNMDRSLSCHGHDPPSVVRINADISLGDHL